MPATTAAYEDDDPVVASYDVFITSSELQPKTSTQSKYDSRLFVLQYPAYRRADEPYNDARLQKPSRLRLKPNTGMVEVEVPILGRDYFSTHTGRKFGQALAESRTMQSGGSHGLTGGFSSGQHTTRAINLHDVPAHGDGHDGHILETQTLGGKIAIPGERDPVYMLGSFHNDELHLTHLDALVQMRPQFHHIDAEEENNQKGFQAGAGSSGKNKPGFEAPPSRLESKAIELKMKDSKEDPKDRNLNVNAHLLRNIQADQWKTHDWVDEEDEESQAKADTHIRLNSDGNRAQLRSTITNDDWLDRMSVPREDGKKGLRAKLKGRDRERARRKKVEHQKRMQTAETVNSASKAGADSESELTSASGHSDIEVLDGNAELEEVEIKAEPGSLAAAPFNVSSMPTLAPAGDVPKKRGRPRKNQA